MGFAEGLRITLALTIDGKPYEVPASNVKAFSFGLTSWGFEGSLEFLMVDDKAYGGTTTDLLAGPFLKQDLVAVKLSMQSTYQEKTGDDWPLVLQGIGTAKRLHETVTTSISELPVLMRRYHLDFADPAAVLWSQHWPTELWVDKAPKDIFEAYKGSEITLSYDWTALTEKLAVQLVGLGAYEGQPRPSFYDFLVWRVEHLGGFFVYDNTKNSYKLLGARSDPLSPVLVHSDDIERVRIVFPQTRRFAAEVLNSYTEGAKKNAISNDQAVSGLTRSVLVRTPLTSEVNARKTLETARMKAHEHELELSYTRWPTVATLPGYLYKLTGTLWTSKQFTHSHTYRLWKLEVRATNVEHEAVGLGDEYAEFEVTCSTRLESKDHPHARLPEFQAPIYPVYVEGKVLSEEGPDTDETFQVYTDSNTSLDQYKVKIPLWKDQKVVAPYEPYTMPGQFFFPLLKDARVLVGFAYDHAWIARHLEWRPGAQMAMDTQGNHILFGKSPTSQTSLSHQYEENKPVFKLKRTNDKDTATIRLEEGSMLFEVTEE